MYRGMFGSKKGGHGWKLFKDMMYLYWPSTSWFYRHDAHMNEWKSDNSTFKMGMESSLKEPECIDI